MNAIDTTDPLSWLSLLGIEWPNPAYLVGAMAFGIAGLVAFRIGRRAGRRLTWSLGLALMFFPYFVTGTGLMYGVGSLLCAAAWLTRD